MITNLSLVVSGRPVTLRKMNSEDARMAV
jgi:hypothetical protein